MPAKKKAVESAKFRIITQDGNILDLDFGGSVVSAMVEAFTWLPAERRQRMMEMLAKKNGELIIKEAERAAAGG